MVRTARQTLSRPSSDLENVSEELGPGGGVTATSGDLVVTENGAKTEHCPSDTWGPFGAEGENETEQVLEDLFGENGASKGVRKLRMAPSPLGLILPLLPFQSQFLGWALDQEKGPIRGGYVTGFVFCNDRMPLHANTMFGQRWLGCIGFVIHIDYVCLYCAQDFG